MIRTLFSIGFLFFGVSTFAQVNIVEIAALSETVNESSGLIYLNGRLVTHNDSGNTPQLFELDPQNGQILRTISLSNANNIDWEDITQDDRYIYIGDFGNNSGDRTDLTIYRIDKTDFESSDTVSAEVIQFSYENQTDFTTSPNSDWDAEALIAFDDQLVVFTKQWQTMGTVAYGFPKTPGVHSAQLLENYDVNGLITGATWQSDSQRLVLVGYSILLSPFLLQIEGVTSSNIFTEEISKLLLNSNFLQVEGITSSENTYFLTSEEFTNSMPPINSTARLFSLELEPINQENPEPGEKLIIYQPDGGFSLNYELQTDDTVFQHAIFDNSGREIQFFDNTTDKQGSIDISILSPSIYFISFFLREGSFAKSFVIR